MDMLNFLYSSGMPVHTSAFFTLELHLIALHNQIENIKSEYKEKEFDLGWNYKKQIKKLEKENNHLHKIIDKFYETVDNFIKWICHKFGIGESKELIKNFQEENHTFIDPVKQIEHEKLQFDFDLDK